MLRLYIIHMWLLPKSKITVNILPFLTWVIIRENWQLLKFLTMFCVAFRAYTGILLSVFYTDFQEVARLPSQWSQNYLCFPGKMCLNWQWVFAVLLESTHLKIGAALWLKPVIPGEPDTGHRPVYLAQFSLLTSQLSWEMAGSLIFFSGSIPKKEQWGGNSFWLIMKHCEVIMFAYWMFSCFL